MAKFKLDENLPAEAAELLRSAGHDAATVFEQHMTGFPTPLWQTSAGAKAARL